LTLNCEGVKALEYKTGDIVRLNESERKGLYEIVDCMDKSGDYTVTNDECDSEYYAHHSHLILVCSVKDRKDI
jgi:hypothetical protein